MASTLQLLLLAAVALLISPATSQSQTCRSQTFNTTYANCMDLPTLRAYLHWNYNPSSRPTPTLDIAFLAPPAAPGGWVAWALNPTSTRMIGSQALVAYPDGANGSLAVRTFNITSYTIMESPIDYEVFNRSAESSGGLTRMFATLRLPAGHALELNQVWQVGAAVTNGVPAVHAMEPENMNSVGVLRLGDTAEGPTPPPTSGSGGGGTEGGPTPPPTSGSGGGGTEGGPPPSGSGGGGTEGGNSSGSWRASASGLGGSLMLLGLFLGF